MGRLIFSLIVIIGGLTLGQIVYKVTKSKSETIRKKIEKTVFFFRNIAFLGLGPFLSMSAFWIVDIRNISIVAVPFIGLGALVLGSVSALVLGKIFKHSRQQKGSMFSCGSSSNIGTIGSLICFAFFGELGFAFCGLYRIFELPYYATVLFPAAKSFSDVGKQTDSKWYIRLIKDPIIVIYFGCIIIGLVLNLTGVKRPAFIAPLNSALIPISSLFLITAIGYSMRFSKISNYKKEILGIAAIKFVLTPLIVITSSLLLGLHHIGDGVLFGSLVILSALPCGFNSLIPVQMYKLDINLANSCWIVTTTSLVVVVPVIWLFVG